ncbi:MAG: Hsp20/alpha crystallin family protein [Anaerolineales bacterium]
MTYFIAPYPYRMARRLARLAADCTPAAGFSLAVNVREDEDAFSLQALVPGLKAEDLNIQILENLVTIEGEFKQEESDYLLRELPHGPFRRTLRFSAPIEAEKAEARIRDGVLTLHLPKAESARPKSIKISAK